MYNPMNTDLMFQVMHDREEAMRHVHTGSSDREARRWWRRSASRHAG